MKIRTLCLVLLTVPLLAQSISPQIVNQMIDYKKEKLLSAIETEELAKPQQKNVYKSDFKVKEIKEPIKESYPDEKELVKGKFEKTVLFEQRKAKEKQRVIDAKSLIDSKYEKNKKNYLLKQREEEVKANKLYKKALKDSEDIYKKDLAIYAQKLKKKELEKQVIKKSLNKKLSKALGDSLNIYLGKPSINDFSNYNADDEVYETKIESRYFNIPIQIQISPQEAQKLEENQDFKDLKPTVTFEYADNNLYVSAVAVKLKNKAFNVAISGLKDYDTSFKLKHKLQNTFIKWRDIKIKDKSLIDYFKKLNATISPKKTVYRNTKNNWDKSIYKGKRSYTKNSTNTVKDNLTGLIWQKTGSSSEMQWEKAKEYCSNLNKDGYSNWRLPTIKELRYLADRKKYKPSIDTHYFNSKNSWYWSATEYSGNSSEAWRLGFNGGDGNYYSESNGYYVRCVVGRQ